MSENRMLKWKYDSSYQTKTGKEEQTNKKLDWNNRN